MKLPLLAFILFFTAVLIADVPEPVLTVGEVYGRLAVVAGKLSTPPERAVGISVLNGNLISSTVTDPEGRWSIVIRHLANEVSVSSWDFLNPAERSVSVKGILGNPTP